MEFLNDCGGEFDRMDARRRCCVFCGCLSFITIIVYIAVAIEGVEPTEFAIIRNNISQDIDRDNILEGGLHWVGILNSLIHFPSIHKSIEFSDDASQTYREDPLNTRTKEGLNLQLHFSFQYQLRKEDLPDMYKVLYTDYEKIFTRIARNAVLIVAGNYKANAYWKQRTERDMDAVRANVTGFMLLKIDLPNNYEQAIVQTEVTNQEKITREHQRESQKIDQETENIRAEAEKDITVINTKAERDATIIREEGKGQLIFQNVDYTRQALVAVKQDLCEQFDSCSDFPLHEYYKYQRIAALGENTMHKLIIGDIQTTMIR